MSEEIPTDSKADESVESREQVDAPAVLKLTERILDTTDPIGASNQLDVACIFYTAVATVMGSLCAACLYLAIHSFSSQHPVGWFVLMLCVVAAGGFTGAAGIALAFNARGYTRWERKYRPDELP